MVTGFAHVALYAKDLDAAVKFYRDVFDAELVGKFETDKRGCWLTLNGDILEIFEGDLGGDGHFQHIAIGCDDPDALYAKALENGASPLMPLTDITLAFEKPVAARIAFVRGAAGEQIELFAQK